MPDLFVQIHLGLGDLIVCCGLIRELAKENEKVTIPSYESNLNSAKYAFSDNPKIHVHKVSGDSHASQIASIWERDGKKALRLGMHAGTPFDFSKWDSEFYRQAGIPFEKRWDSFFIPYEVSTQVVPPENPYAFIHEDVKRGFIIKQKNLPSLEWSKPYMTSTIFDWRWNIERANQIHCVDSSFLCLADSIKDYAEKRVVHKYARNSVPPQLRKEWKVI